MERDCDLHERCVAAVAALNLELGWECNEHARQAYSAALPQYLSSNCSEQRIRTAAVHYHQDHVLVQSLLTREHVQHDTAWSIWTRQVIPILRHAELAWSDDSAIDLEDLAQIARAELARALPSFRYASRFSTWAHQVIVWSVQRYIRSHQAVKRAGHLVSLEQILAADNPAIVMDWFESEAEARVLAVLIDNILSTQPDHRLVAIFRLRTEHDMRVEQIGQLIRLSPSQVRVLLKRICSLLQQNTTISTWCDDSAGVGHTD